MLMLVVSMITFMPGSAMACSCIEEEAAAQLARADAVFTGRVVEREEPVAVRVPLLEGGDHHVQWTFDVEGVEKGDVHAVQPVQSGASSAACGFEFSLGSHYRVLAERADGGGLVTGLCHGTTAVAAGDAVAGDPPAAAPGQEPPAANPQTAGSWLPVAAVSAGGLFVLAVAAAVALRRSGRFSPRRPTASPGA